MTEIQKFYIRRFGSKSHFKTDFFRAFVARRDDPNFGLPTTSRMLFRLLDRDFGQESRLRGQHFKWTKSRQIPHLAPCIMLFAKDYLGVI